MTKVFGLLFLLALFCTVTQAKIRHKSDLTTSSSPNKVFKGFKFNLLYQVFESHDATGTNIDTVRHPGDLIYFAPNGTAYIKYNNNNDSIGYQLIGNDSLSFGDTPFLVTAQGNGYYTLYQNEEEPNGDYNRVTYLVKREETEQTVSKR